LRRLDLHVGADGGLVVGAVDGDRHRVVPGLSVGVQPRHRELPVRAGDLGRVLVVITPVDHGQVIAHAARRYGIAEVGEVTGYLAVLGDRCERLRRGRQMGIGDLHRGNSPDLASILVDGAEDDGVTARLGVGVVPSTWNVPEPVATTEPSA
jgi:hypothetical protein